MCRSGWVGRMAVAALLVSGSAVAAEPHVRFRLHEPFRVGSHDYDSGVIALNNVSSLTPSRSILEVWVNGECLGMMTAHQSRAEAAAPESEALFRRDDTGRLEMVGFRVAGPEGATYRFPVSDGHAGSSPAVAIAMN